MSIEAMKLALEALELAPYMSNKDDHDYYAKAIEALRTAIQQAESGPVAKAWADGYRQGIEDERTSEANIGVAGFGAKVNPSRENPYGDTHTAPGVPDDVVRDAERYRWLKAYDQNSEDMGICKWVDEGWSGQWVLEHDPDTSIDAAMLAASPAQKGGE